MDSSTLPSEYRQIPLPYFSNLQLNFSTRTNKTAKEPTQPIRKGSIDLFISRSEI